MTFQHDAVPRVVVVHARYTDQLSYYDDWHDAFRDSSALDTRSVDIVPRGSQRELEREVRAADLVVVLHSVLADSLAAAWRVLPSLAGRQSPMLAFVGNEVNLPGSLVSEKIRWLREAGAQFVGTQLPLAAGQYLYDGRTSATTVALPHALNPEAFAPRLSDDERDIDLGVRSNRYLPYLGDDDRDRIFEFFSTHEFDPPLVVDLGVGQRFDRDGWAGFLNRCRGTVATEAGSRYLQPDDRTVIAIREYLRAGRSRRTVPLNSRLFNVWKALPEPLKALIRRAQRRGLVSTEQELDEDLSFDEIYERFFRDTPEAPVYTKCLSSRHWDAIGTKTCQIMFRGEFNGILEADRHYLALEPDFGNVDDVVERFRDPSVRSGVVDAAYELALEGHTYRHRVDQVLGLLR